VLIISVVSEALAVLAVTPPPRAQPMVLAMVSLLRLPQAAEAVQAVQAQSSVSPARAAWAAMPPRMQ
jgi:hypothetical protein